ncbi:SDR family NAD(P)-dependent oxidoreductase [Pelagihabitans pacificus]|nr:SDR family NAD(P)-dependent oxidoreductase [Pelagihabitans pacificus]
MDFQLTGKTALITGSSSGLGNIMAEGLAQQGVHVLLNGRNERKLQASVAEFHEKGYKATPFAFDVTNASDIAQNARRIHNEVGPLDILVNNAGVQRRHPLEDFPEEAFDEVITTNLKAAYLVSKAFVKPMIAQKAGKIVNICSLQSTLGRATITPYAASKGGLKMMTRGMATEWAGYNIQVNAIGPGYFKTEMTRALYEDGEFDRWLCQRTPANRWGNPEELIGTLLYLSSGASSFVNGQIIYVDGGITACI